MTSDLEHVRFSLTHERRRASPTRKPDEPLVGPALALRRVCVSHNRKCSSGTRKRVRGAISPQRCGTKANLIPVLLPTNGDNFVSAFANPYVVWKLTPRLPSFYQ